MAKKNKRRVVALVSKESGQRTYVTTKNFDNTKEKLTLRKYDPKLRKYATFVETTKNLGRNEV